MYIYVLICRELDGSIFVANALGFKALACILSQEFPAFRAIRSSAYCSRILSRRINAIFMSFEGFKLLKILVVTQQ